MRKILATFCAMAILASAGSAFAVTGDILATANVLQPLTVSNNLRDLDFGDVFPGLAKSILYTDLTSGKWSIAGELGKEVDLSFTLPANLQFGANLMPITFGGADAAWHDADAVGSATSFDPGSGATEFLNAATGDMYVWIGGTVNPSGTQAAGAYTGTITLDVVYTGN